MKRHMLTAIRYRPITAWTLTAVLLMMAMPGRSETTIKEAISISPLRQFNTYARLDSPGGQLAFDFTEDVIPFSECLQACLDTNECVAASVINAECHLKAELAEALEEAPTGSLYELKKVRDFVVETNVTYKSFGSVDTIAAPVFATLTQCRQLCMEEDACLGFLFEPECVEEPTEDVYVYSCCRLRSDMHVDTRLNTTSVTIDAYFKEELPERLTKVLALQLTETKSATLGALSQFGFKTEKLGDADIDLAVAEFYDGATLGDSRLLVIEGELDLDDEEFKTMFIDPLPEGVRLMIWLSGEEMDDAVSRLPYVISWNHDENGVEGQQMEGEIEWVESDKNVVALYFAQGSLQMLVDAMNTKTVFSIGALVDLSRELSAISDHEDQRSTLSLHMSSEKLYKLSVRQFLGFVPNFSL